MRVSTGWCWEPYYGKIKVWDEEAKEGGGLGQGCARKVVAVHGLNTLRA